MSWLIEMSVVQLVCSVFPLYQPKNKRQEQVKTQHVFSFSHNRTDALSTNMIFKYLIHQHNMFSNRKH